MEVLTVDVVGREAGDAAELDRWTESGFREIDPKIRDHVPPEQTSERTEPMGVPLYVEALIARPAHRMAVVDEHPLVSETFTCERDQQRWPCAEVRRGLRQTYRGRPTDLVTYMGTYLNAAREDGLSHLPAAEIWDVVVGWALDHDDPPPVQPGSVVSSKE